MQLQNILILSDIHANLTALNTVLDRVDINKVDGILLLGDIIDYGPRSNEVIERICNLPQEKILVNIWGNHEHAIMTSCYEHFSSKRGVRCAQYTKSLLAENALTYLNEMNSQGVQEFFLNQKRCLAVHGSLQDLFWKSIKPGEFDEQYAKYDYVFSGHSHLPHYFETYYECDAKEYRNKKKTVFINPGSVGQPRNHNPNANYAILNLSNDTITMHSAEYDYEFEMSLFSDKVDEFYRERLRRGI